MGYLIAALVLIAWLAHRSEAPDFGPLGKPAPLATPIPTAVDTPATEAAVASTLRVASFCGSGAGWPIAPQYVVTASHVTVGTQQGIEVQQVGGASRQATVVYFNDKEELSVLYVPGADFEPMRLSPTDPNPGPALAIGFPGDQSGAEGVASAQLIGPAKTYWDYPQVGTQREMEAMNAPGVVPGFSGGPVVDPTGVVVGMVVGGAGGQADAVLPSQMQSLLPSVVGTTSAVQVGNVCLSQWPAVSEAP